MAKQLIVYGGTYDGRNRLIVAAYTKKAAYEAIAAVAPVGSYKTWIDYTSDSGNDEDIEATRQEPGVVFKASITSAGRGGYTKLSPRNA